MRILVGVMLGLASVAHADVTRAKVEARLAESIRDIKQCGAGSWRGVFDWKAYDAIDWSKQEHNKKEFLGYETSTVENVGGGVNDACKRDSDCKAVIGKVDTIVYKITDDKTKRLEASISGSTLTFVDHAFGSTRIGYDFEEATLAACENATIDASPTQAPAPKSEPKPDPKPEPKPPAKDTKKASSKWDGKYVPDHTVATMWAPGCNAVANKELVVSHGKFSFPWYIDDWNAKTDDDGYDHPVAVGHVDGTVHDDGTTFTTVVFDNAELNTSKVVRVVRVKRLLDGITAVPVTFSLDDKDKVVAVDFQANDRRCAFGWAIRAPRVRKNPNDEYDGDWGRHMSDQEYEQTPVWNKDTTYHRGTRVRVQYNNPNAVFYACQDDQCLYEPGGNGDYGWHLLGWSNRTE